MPERGEVWQVDFGITQKVRPALVISIPYGDTNVGRPGSTKKAHSTNNQ